MSKSQPSSKTPNSKPKEKAVSPLIQASELKKTGTLTPAEVAAYMLLAEFPKDPKVISEGIGTVKSECSFILPNNAQGPSGHVGMWAEGTEGFPASAASREDPLESTIAARKNWEANHHSFFQAWGQWEQEQGGLVGGGAAVYGPEYLKVAEEVIEKGVAGATGGVGGSTSESSGEVTGGVNIQEVEAAAKAAAFSTYLEIPGLFDGIESQALKGQRSLMNDQPLLTFIEELCQASLRRFQSMPNGNFYAFYPDYFGGMNHRTPYWEIHDIEILDGKINLSDEALATHVYVVGDSVGYYDGVNEADLVSSSGVCTLFHAMAANFVTGLGQEPHKKASKEEKRAEAVQNKQQAINFLKKYGARPFFEEAPMVRSGYYEMFLAFQRFCLLWSKQFLTEFELTYMPELFPGGLVAFPDHQLQLFVEEVSHEFDYENGFTTVATFSAPTSLEDGPAGVHDGMIRADALT